MFSILADFFYILSQLTDKEYESYDEVLKERMWRLCSYCSFAIIFSVCMILFEFNGVLWNIIFGLNIIVNIVVFAYFYPEISQDIKRYKKIKKNNM